MVRVKKIVQSEEKSKKTTKKTNLDIALYNLKGQEEDKFALPKEIFTADINDKLLAQYVRVYQANQRQGNASTKTRGEVNGSTKKIYRQKGTGRARHGAKKAPIFVGGGVSGGPIPHDFSLKINKKQRTKALFSALSLKNKEGNIIGLVDESVNIEPKTRIFNDFLKNIKLNHEKVLLVIPELKEKNLILATRNIKNITLCSAMSLSPYLLLNNQKIILIKKTVEIIKKHFKTKNEN